MIRYSLLHASYRAGTQAVAVRDRWCASAASPERVEHIFSVDDDDEATLAATAASRRCVNPALQGRVTAVRNWNAAALSASGDLLIVIADDLTPGDGWDSQLDALLCGFDPVAQQFAIKISDDPGRSDTLLRHPIVSRAFYSAHGLFSPSFDGVFCDNDISLRAFFRAVILDGREIRFEHSNPLLSVDHVATPSHERMNRDDEYRRGKAEFHRTWPRWQRTIIIRLASPSALRFRGKKAWAGYRGCLRSIAVLDLAVKATRRVVSISMRTIVRQLE